MIETECREGRRAILVGVRIGKANRFDACMQELGRLAEACALVPAGTLVQNLDRPEAATYLGSGKLGELKALAAEAEADCVIFLNALSPAQLSNLARALELEVLDKTNLILQIFDQRARTAEARMQVEYARLEYMLPRLVGLRQNLSRQGGTGGSLSNKGSGEKQIELDRRHIEKRMSELRRGLRQVESGRETQRKKRQASGLPLVALAGYTNAGKSTLMNRMLTDYQADETKQVFEKDMLFATLDTTVRRIMPGDNRDFLLSDTVGFLEDLPHDLIQAFRSTLGEIRLADLILQVVDYSDEEYLQHIAVTEKTLQELGAAHIPMIYVMNKADKVPALTELPLIHGDRIFLSAKKGIGIPALTQLIQNHLFGAQLRRQFLIPYKDAAAEHLLRSEASVLGSEYRAEGIWMDCRLSERIFARAKAYALPENQQLEANEKLQANGRS